MGTRSSRGRQLWIAAICGSVVAVGWLAVARARWEPEAALHLVRRELGDRAPAGGPVVVLAAKAGCSPCRAALLDFTAPLSPRAFPVDRCVVVDRRPPALDLVGDVPIVVDARGEIRGCLGNGLVPAYLLFDSEGAFVSVRRGSYSPAAIERWIRHELEVSS